MLELEKRLGGLEMEDEEAIYNKALYELSKCEPMGIESQLADESQMIENVDEKISGLADNQFHKLSMTFMNLAAMFLYLFHIVSFASYLEVSMNYFTLSKSLINLFVTS
jgi:uncharacterized membrane protein (DUF106 family)